ncbi:MAG: anti-sigma factor family protein, partial [Alphaproteobacteria bacterium]
MTQNPQNVGDADLDRFVDDRLDPDRRAEIASYLGEHSDIAAEVEAQVRLNALLRDRYAPVLDEPVPAALLRAAARG